MTRQPRKWIKLYCYERLHGSVSYQLTEAEQSIWDKLLCLAGLCGNDGIIADHDLRPYPKEFIIHELHADTEVFNSTMEKCKAEGRINEDGQGIRIVNWNKYQSEYDRQKQYRDRGIEGKKYGEFQNVLLTDEEYQWLLEKLGEESRGYYIEKLSCYLESKGKDKYKSHYAAILNWQRRDQDGKNTNTRKLPKKYSEAPAYQD